MLHEARVAAVTAKKALGEWLEEAMQERIAGKKTEVMRKEDGLIRRETKVPKDSKVTA